VRRGGTSAGQGGTALARKEATTSFEIHHILISNTDTGLPK